MAKQPYLVNWRLEGISKDPLQEGDTVNLEPADAEPFLANGTLSVAAPAPPSDSKKA